ncbi:Brain protein I3-like 2, partial [Homarus americanus]
ELPPPYSTNPSDVKVTVIESGASGYDSSDYRVYQQQVITTQPQAGTLQKEFTCCGICIGVFFFPLGLLCCFLMQERRCSNCRMSFGSV